MATRHFEKSFCAACGGVSILEQSTDAGVTPSAPSDEDGAVTLPTNDASAIEASPIVEAGAGDAEAGCPAPGDAPRDAGTVPLSCEIISRTPCSLVVTRALACAMANDSSLCGLMHVCDDCSVFQPTCSVPYLPASDAGTCETTGPNVTITCMAQAGRRPSGLAPHGTCLRDPIARFFVECAWLEAASVLAFERLAAELRAFGAPEALARDCESAAREEEEHARAMGAMSKRHGGTTVPPTVGPMVTRSLVELACENAVEGCVKETFAAAVAVVQSVRAEDPELRRCMKKIAREEASHADLSRRIDLWARTQLDENEQSRVDTAGREAVRRLAKELTCATLDDRLRRIAGLPTSAESARILSLLAA